MDIDAGALSCMETVARRMIEQGGYGATLVSTTERREALDGADFVVVAILVGGREPIQWEIDIPLQYGVDQCIGDTMGPGGIIRAMRTIPVMVDIARDMEEFCPDALMLNYVNPMSMICQALRQVTSIEVVGLCHSVQGAHAELAQIIGAGPDHCASWVAGINHQAWVLEFTHNGEDAYPLVRRAAWENEDWYTHNTTRVEMLRQLGYYVTESSGHNSEYNPWFRKRPDLMAKYTGEGWNGETGYIKKLYPDDRDERLAKFRAFAEQTAEFRLERGHEYGSYIMNAVETGEPFRFNGTVENTGLITNLPWGCSVEVPCYAEKNGVRPCCVGELPAQLAALNSMAVNSASMAVEACLTGDRDLLYWSVLYDPLTAAVCSMQEAREMVDEMFEKGKNQLPTFA
jgi:alpha-galactosidase